MALLLFALGMNCRRYCQLMLLLIFITLAFSVSLDVYVSFITVAVFIFLFLLVDCMFCNEKDFLYDPNYDNWLAKTQK
eukprot:maker-scaffold_6-snap-gene-18.46-mRNA-1 protein AED:0.00 eAED:0.00 QI:125/1/1/1/1/1/2/133/77